MGLSSRCLAVFLCTVGFAALCAQDAPKIDRLLPDSGGSGVPVVRTLAPVAGGAVAAMLAVPPKYADGILEVTGRDGSPNPKEWTLQAWNTEDPGTVHKLTVVGDQFVSDALSVNIYEAERKEINIPMSAVGIDSGGVWEIARSYAAANGTTLGRVDFMLTCHAKKTPPVWTAECHDPAGKPLGKLEILATSGTVRNFSGFKNAPR